MILFIVKAKYRSVHPTQSCEICFTSLLAQTFYAFHCGHGFHRECLVDELEHYETKNYKLISKMELLRTFAGEIKATQSKAEFLRNEEQNFDPQDRTMSWFSGLAKKFKSSIYSGSGDVNDRAKLSIEDQRKVEDLYGQIDIIMKEECYLCGEMLIGNFYLFVALDLIS